MKNQRFVSIRIKLLSLLFICILIPFLVYWFFSYQYIRTSLNEEFVSQTTDTMHAAANSISDYVRLVDYTARGLYFNSEVMDILKEKEKSVSNYRLLQTESKIFDFLQTLYSSVPEAAQIHLSAFYLKKSLLLQSDMQRYEKDHIYLNMEREFPCQPYHSYVTPTNMQSSYNFQELTNRGFSQVFSLHMPIFQIPSVTDSLGEITIDIPVSVLDSICRPLYKDQEYLCVVDGKGNLIYSSIPREIGTQTANRAVKRLLASPPDPDTPKVLDTGRKDIVICSRISEDPADWYLIKVSPKSFIYEKAIRFFNMMLYAFIAVSVIEVLLIFLTAIRFTAPMKKLTVYAEAVSAGNLDANMSSYITYTKNDEIGSLLMAIRKMMDSIKHFTIHQYQLELATRTSELKALQAQINPHFIYNTLQCLATNALEHGNLPLYQSITALGQMMHYSMDTNHSLVTMGDDLHYIEIYLKLQKLRFPNTLVTVFEISDEARNTLIPKMCIQPLVENSIRHGNLLKIENSRLTIRAYMEGSFLHLWVDDTGTGISFDRLDELNRALAQVKASVSFDAQAFVDSLNRFSDEKARIAEESEQRLKADKERHYVSNNIGIRNVYQRLLLNYKNQCTMEIQSNEACGTTVHIQADCRMLEVPPSKEEQS